MNNFIILTFQNTYIKYISFFLIGIAIIKAIRMFAIFNASNIENTIWLSEINNKATTNNIEYIKLIRL